MASPHASVGEQMDLYSSLALEMERIAQTTCRAPAARAEIDQLAQHYRELAARISANLQAWLPETYVAAPSPVSDNNHEVFQDPPLPPRPVAWRIASKRRIRWMHADTQAR